MRFSTIFGASETEAHLQAETETRGVTIDVLMGIVAGFALVLAILILASSLSPASADAATLDAITTVR